MQQSGSKAQEKGVEAAYFLMRAAVTSLGSSVNSASTWPLSLPLALGSAPIWAMNLAGTSSLSAFL